MSDDIQRPQQPEQLSQPQQAPVQPLPENQLPDQQPQPQWIPAGPPHPYAGAASPLPPSSSKALAISAMAVGLVALLTIIVSVAYFNSTVALASGLLGIVAVSLGVIALVKKLRPTGAAITGLVSGALSMVAVTALLGAGLIVTQVSAPVPDDQAGPESGEQWTPETEQEALLSWPANMSSGGIIFEGPGDPRPVQADPLKPGTVPQPHAVDRENSNDILVYVDYRCPHCMDFEQKNGVFLSELIENGNTTVEIMPLSFLDRNSEGAYYSSRAAGAVSCVVDTQPEAAWDAHTALLTPEVQPGAGPGLSNDELIAAIDTGVGGLSSAARDCIATERFVPFAQALNEWVFQNPIPLTNAESVQLSGTPTIVVNGEVYPGDTSDPAMFRAFVEELAN